MTSSQCEKCWTFERMAGSGHAMQDSPVDGALVSVIMGSKRDWSIMQNACDTLDSLGIRYEVRVLSAHRTPDAALTYASELEQRGVQVLVAAAGGAAHLAGVMASKTLLPVLGVPMPSLHLNGLDSLLSTVQMPAGIPVGTLAVGKAGAINAALFAAAILGRSFPEIRGRLADYRARQTADVLAVGDPRV